MAKFQVIAEIEAESFSEAWAISASGHPTSFQPNTDWSKFSSFTIREVAREITMRKPEKENNND